LGAVGARGQGPFVAEIIEISQGEYILRDSDRKRWLRKESELTPAKKAA
jgi:hypothetical protein